ncbi:PhoX family phosphatase [Uliginosibacterium flavum]|uniref:PhoX family phosphatase n=1 Tax=Uliginosibacterium flavum TaxID=1396831 RepID=A0ABV2TMU5_9RHOO
MNDPKAPLSTPLADLIDARLSRRSALKGLLAGASGAALMGSGLAEAAGASSDPSSLQFAQPPHKIEQYQQVSTGHRGQVLIRWGDKVLADAPAFDPLNQSAAAQEKQFGYNNDFVAFMPLPRGSKNSGHGLLCVNQEYTNPELMFPGLTKTGAVKQMNQAQAEIEMAAHGHSVVEIRKTAEGWQVVESSQYNRRISALSTPMTITGPAAGHARLKTKADPTGRHIIGTINNCAGGVTPWGTVLIAEENFNNYFGGDPEGLPEAANYKRLGIKGKSAYSWSRFHERFDIEKEPNEPNRFGWVVEIDPYDPKSVPVKRSTLGRFKHEAATCVVAPNGQVVVYSGDDEAFEYIYRFVTAGKYNANNLAANRDLLDTGVLSVAKFSEDGSLRWLPLVFGQGPLTPANGFQSQADVLIETRRAADLVGATPMDRPEDVEANPVNGRVYVMLTNNTTRKPEQINKMNPRASNAYGHILELLPPGTQGNDGAPIAQHTADEFRWEVLLLAGNPSEPKHGAKYHPDTAEKGNWMAAPDNCCFDNRGRLWITTDQGSAQSKSGIPDGVYACDVSGAGRALPKFFYACPKDAEMCGPAFTPDNRTLFVAVQHPGEDADSTFNAPSTRWPDFSRSMPPRPSVVAITRNDGGVIGG